MATDHPTWRILGWALLILVLLACLPFANMINNHIAETKTLKIDGDGMPETCRGADVEVCVNNLPYSR